MHCRDHRQRRGSAFAYSGIHIRGKRHSDVALLRGQVTQVDHLASERLDAVVARRVGVDGGEVLRKAHCGATIHRHDMIPADELHTATGPDPELADEPICETN